MTQQLIGEEEARRALQANLPPRFYRLDRLQRYVSGTQYEGRPSFWTTEKVPVLERAPCIVYPVVGCGIGSIVDMCLGEGRYPDVVADVDEAFDERFALTEDDAEKISRLIHATNEAACIPTVAADSLAACLGVGSCAAVVGVVRGRLRIEALDTKVCNPTLDADGSVLSVEVRYPYIEEYRDGKTGKWGVRAMLYRRVIDAESDTTYKPAKASEDGSEPDRWVADPARTVKHGLGFCPVVWHKRMAGTLLAGATHDGRAIHASLLDEVDALNFGLSLRHRAALYSSDPQIVEIGVDPMDSPAPEGRAAHVVVGGGIDPVTGAPKPAWTSSKRSGAASKARAKGVGQVWTYESPDAQVAQLTLPGDALKAADDNCRDLRSKIAEALGVVFIDPDNAKFSAELSGKALARLYDRLIRTCDRERADFGHGFLHPLYALCLRVCMKVGPGLRMGGLKEALPILQRFVDGDEWFAPELDLSWGPYFELDAADADATVKYVAAARTATLITLKTAVQELSDVFDIGDVEQYVSELEEEAEEKRLKAQEDLAHQAEVAASTGVPAAGPAKPGIKKPPIGAPK